VRAFVTINGVNYYGKYSEPVSQLAHIQLTVKIENGKVVLSWTKYQNITRYRLYCKPQSQSNYVWIQTVNNALTYSCDQYSAKGGTDSVILNFIPGVTYDFRVRAVLSTSPNVYSKYSNEPALVIDNTVNPAESGVKEIMEPEILDTEDTELTDIETTDTQDVEITETTDTETQDTDTADNKTEDTEAQETKTSDSKTQDTKPAEPLDTQLPEVKEASTE